MLSPVAALVLSLTLPTPSQALLDVPTPVEVTDRLLAQSPDPDLEADLERDMERARRRTRPAVQGRAPRRERAREPYRDERGRRPPPYEVVDEDGKGKVHYLVWGIVDWVIAGGLFGATAVTGVYAGALGLAAASDDVWAADREAMRTAALVCGGVAVTTGLIGALLSWKASSNIRTYREMKAVERQRRYHHY